MVLDVVRDAGSAFLGICALWAVGYFVQRRLRRRVPPLAVWIVAALLVLVLSLLVGLDAQDALTSTALLASLATLAISSGQRDALANRETDRDSAPGAEA